MPEPNKPVFYDQSRRRWAWTQRVAFVMAFVAISAITAFLVSVLALPLLPHNLLPRVRGQRDVGNPTDPVANDRRRAKRQYIQKDEKLRLAELIRQEKHRKPKGRPNLPAKPSGAEPSVVGAFYVNWEETSLASLHRNVGEITHFFPEWLHITADGTGIVDGRIPSDYTEVDPLVRAGNIPILPIINNFSAKNGNEKGDWNTDSIHNLLTSAANRTAMIKRLQDMVVRNRWQGINIDFEIIPSADKPFLTAFMVELYVAFHSVGLLVTEDVQIEDDAFDYAALADANDFIIPMMYDEHSPNDENGAGSIAGIAWTRKRLEEFFAMVSPSKVILGLGNYAYDWRKGENSAATLTYQSAIIQAKESQDPDNPNTARIQMDPKTLNPYYRYMDEEHKEHTVWMMDATTLVNQWLTARKWKPAGYALWYLGSEDPAIWSVLGRSKLTADTGALVDHGALNNVTYGRQSQVDFEGEGELLEVLAEPSDGKRTVVRDAATGLIKKIAYETFPSSYVVRRYGHRPKSIVLTFDDGPDSTFTPKILDILKRENVKATFFVIGSQAESNPNLVARIWDEGHEIGNHTFFHPNLGTTGVERTLLEITTTQRIIESITGRQTILFRPPFAIDVEPSTGDQLRPIILASKWGFISVGEKIDPQDWNLVKLGINGVATVRTAVDIADSVFAARDDGNVVLLHDGGGNRAATVAALPEIIRQMKEAGYTFINTSDLLPGAATRDKVMPRLSKQETTFVGIDKWVFWLWYLAQIALVSLFTLSIVLGISRQLIVAVLAMLNRKRTLDRDMMSVAKSSSSMVSVIIAGYNEEKVICRTIHSVLQSTGVNLELIVIDDGSSDNTLAVVQSEFADEARVKAIRKPNGGKASAINLGIEQSCGEVIVALDADTLFEPDTIARLARHFLDPNVGAVAGNVKVGNVHNLVTRWQSLEYITSQNFDRRAYDLLNCITVVPGAVGAWRRSAVEQVGGYAEDTLAEDMDLTWRIRMNGLKVINDSTANAHTEAPDTLRTLARQRFRWAFGTLQNLFKHREATFRYGMFGWFALPSLWLYQILFPAISPIMDVAVVWSLFAGNFVHVGFYYLLMVGAEAIGAALALAMDKGNFKLLPWLLIQRIAYRQVMYYVVLKSLVSALKGGAVGWGKLQRKGTVVVKG